MFNMSSTKTRNISGTNLSKYIGPGTGLILSELPTVRAVIQLGILYRESELIVKEKKTKVRDIALYCTSEVLKQWERANVKFKHPVVIQKQALCKKNYLMLEQG